MSQQTYVNLSYTFTPIDTHFAKGQIFNKIFNRNTITVIYGCVQNIEPIIKNHNINFLHQISEIKDG